METILNWIAGVRVRGRGGVIEKVDPHTGRVLYGVTDSTAEDVAAAVAAAQAAQPAWEATPPVRRGEILERWAEAMRAAAPELQAIVVQETGKPPQDAAGEVGGAIAQAEFFAGEGMRLYGRSLPSGMANKFSHTVRQAHGVCGLIVPANTPIANVAWKSFPALICGNAAVLKASEDAPLVAVRMAELAADAGVPAGVFNVVQGRGNPAGRALVLDERVRMISFTGSTSAGRWIGEAAGRRLARVSLELGGKNPLVVCDDADLDHAVHWAALSAFSNAGQRCASGSRLLVADAVYDVFAERLVARARSLRLGVAAGCDLGPVIHRRQQQSILRAIKQARAEGGRVLVGGSAPDDPGLAAGCYVLPTLVGDLPAGASLLRHEVFGPVATLQRFGTMHEALALAHDTEYGLTAAIHTRSVDRAMWFAQRVRAGVANINLGTYGSEPHMPFGGFGASGNGTREPGTEALSLYSELKNISFLVRPDAF